jgi:hypothetical protein
MTKIVLSKDKYQSDRFKNISVILLKWTIFIILKKS